MSSNPKNLAARDRIKLAYLPAAGVIHGALACMRGGEKYDPYNWRVAEQKIALMEYASGIERHLKAWTDREDRSLDDDVHHLGHLIACAAIMLDAIELGHCIDDRPPKGAAAEIMRRETEHWQPHERTYPYMDPLPEPPRPANFLSDAVDPRAVNMRKK